MEKIKFMDLSHHNLFDTKPEIYARSRPLYPDSLFEYLSSLCKEHQAAWDGACGNGQASVGLAQYFDVVQATDISKEQISNAIPNPKVKYSVQPSEHTNFLHDQFDLVCIAQALHWFNYDQFWPEVKRILKPGGIFTAWGYSWFSANNEIDDCINEKFLKIIEAWWAPQNKLLWDHYQNIPFPFEPLDSPEINLSVEWDLDQLFAFLHSWSATRQRMEEKGTAFFLEAFDSVKALWGDRGKKRKVDLDFCILVGRHEN